MRCSSIHDCWQDHYRTRFIAPSMLCRICTLHVSHDLKHKLHELWESHRREGKIYCSVCIGAIRDSARRVWVCGECLNPQFLENWFNPDSQGREGYLPWSFMGPHLIQVARSRWVSRGGNSGESGQGYRGQSSHHEGQTREE